MSESYYLERMAEAQDQANAAKLENVRERCLRSADAWKAMAARMADTAERKKGNAKPLRRT